MVGWSAVRSLAIISGAIFNNEQKSSPIELAFKYAVYKINKDKIILPQTTLVYDIQYVPKDDSFHASKKGIYNQMHALKADFDSILNEKKKNVLFLCVCFDFIRFSL